MVKRKKLAEYWKKATAFLGPTPNVIRVVLVISVSAAVIANIRAHRIVSDCLATAPSATQPRRISVQNLKSERNGEGSQILG